MNYIQDAGRVIAQSMKQTVASLKYIPLLVALQMGLSIVVLLLMTTLSIFGGGGFMSGILYALIRAAMWSVYLYLLSHAIYQQKFTAQDLTQGMGVYFRDVYTAAFVLYLVQMIVQLSGLGSLPYLDILLLLILSALPETIYLARNNGFGNITESIEFLKENGYLWIPVTILSIVLLKIFGYGVTLMIPTPFWADLSLLVPAILHSVLFALLAIWRGHMFRILYGSNIRKRSFMAKF